MAKKPTSTNSSTDRKAAAKPDSTPMLDSTLLEQAEEKTAAGLAPKRRAPAKKKARAEPAGEPTKAPQPPVSVANSAVEPMTTPKSEKPSRPSASEMAVVPEKGAASAIPDKASESAALSSKAPPTVEELPRSESAVKASTAPAPGIPEKPAGAEKLDMDQVSPAVADADIGERTIVELPAPPELADLTLESLAAPAQPQSIHVEEPLPAEERTPTEEPAPEVHHHRCETWSE